MSNRRKIEKLMVCSGNSIIRICGGRRAWAVDQELSKALNGRMRGLCLPTVVGRPVKIFKQGYYYVMVPVP